VTKSRDRGWAFDVELLSTLYSAGYSVREFPINWYHDDNSKIQLLSDGFKMLKAIYRIYRERAKQSYSEFLFHQHYYFGQGTYRRAEGFANQIANRKTHVTITCANESFSLWPKITTNDSSPYINIIRLPRISSNTNIFDMVYRLPFAIWILLSRKYELLYVFALGVPTNSIAAVASKTIRRIPVIVDWDDLWYNGYGKYAGGLSNFILGISERTGLRLLSPLYVTCVSTFLRDQAIALGIPREKIRVLSNGVLPENIPFSSAPFFRAELGFRADGRYLISVGNTYGESFLNLIEAFKIVHTKRDDIYLILLGDFMKGGALGEMIKEIIRTNRSLFLTHIKVLGKVPYEEYKKYLVAADAAILPMEDTDVDRARFPIRFCDYVKYHLPIVSNATGEVLEIMSRYRLGIYHDVRDLNGLAEDIEKILDSSDEFRTKCEFESVLKNELNWETNGRILHSIIRSSLTKKQNT
jgi:glycosyltransferase involved in cell wall biosynthesis